jgi:hypothetical protein
MNSETIRLRLDALKVHLMSIVEADRLYWSEKERSREVDSEYQRRKQWLNEIRWEIATVASRAVHSGTIQ